MQPVMRMTYHGAGRISGLGGKLRQKMMGTPFSRALGFFRGHDAATRFGGISLSIQIESIKLLFLNLPGSTKRNG
jgi:hypothetical protein